MCVVGNLHPEEEKNTFIDLIALIISIQFSIPPNPCNVQELHITVRVSPQRKEEVKFFNDRLMYTVVTFFRNCSILH